MLPINDMVLFVDVVKYNSFTVAAQKNNITSAGVSKRITKLEDSLGVKLLKRTTRSLSLTEAGRILFEHFQNMQADVQNIVEAVQETHKKPKGQIKISSLPNVSNLILAPVMNEFLQKYSDIEISINLNASLGPLPPIGEYDVAFRSGKLIDSTAISRLLFKHDYVVCASPQYFVRHGVPESLEDLKKHNCIDCRHGEKVNQNF